MGHNTPILRVKDISINFGGLRAINSLSFNVGEGDIFSIIGPNGAGKTTAINLITGIYAPTDGEIRYQDQVITRKKPYQVAHMGITRTFQNIQIFQNMSVRENVMVGLHTKTRSKFVRCLLHTPLVRREERIIQTKADQVLELKKQKWHNYQVALKQSDFQDSSGRDIELITCR